VSAPEVSVSSLTRAGSQHVAKLPELVTEAKINPGVRTAFTAKIHAAGWMIEWVARDVRYWHKPDIAIALNHVRYWG